MMLRSVNIRRIVKCPQYSYSTISSTSAKLSTDEKKVPEKTEPTDGLTQSKMVAAAFASLKNISRSSAVSLQDEISAAQDIESVLSFVERPYLSRTNAMLVLAISLITFLYRATFLIRMSFVDSYDSHKLG